MVDSRDLMNSTRNVLPTSEIKLGGLYIAEMNPNYDKVLVQHCWRWKQSCSMTNTDVLIRDMKTLETLRSRIWSLDYVSYRVNEYHAANECPRITWNNMHSKRFWPVQFLSVSQSDQILWFENQSSKALDSEFRQEFKKPSFNLRWDTDFWRFASLGSPAWLVTVLQYIDTTNPIRWNRLKLLLIAHQEILLVTIANEIPLFKPD